MASAKTKTVDITTGVGILSFPRVFKSTAGKKDDGTASYDIQIIIPKDQKDDLRAILKAIREVGMDKWGEKWKSVKTPLRDGDKEADDLTEDGSTTKGEKYPERLGCYFMNARSGKPVAVVARDRSPIDEPSDLYGGCKGKIAVNFYAYTSNGNFGIAAGLNGVQKISDGEPFGNAAPPVESMFDLIDDEDDLGLDDEFEEEEEEEAPAPKKRVAKKSAPAKKVAKRKPAPVEDDLEEEEEDEDDLLDDLDDEDN